MGYYSTGEGQFTITPPLNGKELRGLPNFERTADTEQTLGYGPEVKVEVREDTTYNDDGSETIRRTGTSVVLEYDGLSAKNYYTKEQLQALVNEYPGHQFEGYFEFVGEDGERWREIVKDRKVIEVKPEMRWPE